MASPPRKGRAPRSYEDPRKPDFLYSEGLELTIRPHNPPLPFGDTAGTFRDKKIRPHCNCREKMERFTQNEWCQAHPLIETPPHQSHHSTRKLRITNKIAVEQDRGAQVVLCYLDGDETQLYVAKFYDPLCYIYWHEDTNGYYDAPWTADDDYGREALAYQKLIEYGIDGKFTPKFYGCWTFDRPLFKEPIINGPVRLILMEYLPGVSMEWILKDEKRINEIALENRLNLYAKALEVDTILEFYGVKHNDLAPRNVLLVGPYKGNTMPKVYLIDFNCATIDVPLDSESLDPEQRSMKPVSPRYHHWGNPNSDFLAWLPDPMKDGSYFRGWLKKVWGDEHPQFAGPSGFKTKSCNYDGEVKYAEPRYSGIMNLVE